ncbi:MAG: DNA-processing protein DprA [Kiritimatiellae bacterium]|nr:DNA-processing protein DprA [Kiritimatiellia bacterium]
MTDRQAYIAFNLTEKVGPATVKALASTAGSVSAAWQAYPKKVSRTGAEVDYEAEIRRAEMYGIKIITPADDEYPRILLESPGSPLALYVRGDVANLSLPSVAIVGTRRATSYGLSVANRLAFDLANAGWCVVSGLALGIDAEAHRGALGARGRTVGIIGSALDRFYPEENRILAQDMIAKGGTVVSQFPLGHPPGQDTFPIRNHVVAAITKGIIAVEAPSRSGTLITTSIAADLGRTVMAVPARIDSRMSAGCLKLIREGATLVRNVDDVLEALSDFFPKSQPNERQIPKRAEQDPDAPPYSIEEALVMTHVDSDGISIDEVVRLTKLPVEKVNALAMALRIKGFVKFLPGNRIAQASVPR